MSESTQALSEERMVRYSIGARFSNDLREVLSGTFAARLSGSWSLGEGHMPLSRSRQIYSLSDVDVLVEHRATTDEIVEIKQSVVNTAQRHRLKLAKVSVRNAAEVDALWRGGPSCADHPQLFWAYIGATEAARTCVHGDNFAARTYGLVKFFFKFCRNGGLVSSCPPHSYRELTLAAGNRIDDPKAALRAFEIKIGARRFLEPGDKEVLLSKRFWSEVAGAEDQNTHDLLSVVSDIDRWHGGAASLCVGSYLQRSRMLIRSPEAASAWKKACKDHIRWERKDAA